MRLIYRLIDGYEKVKGNLDQHAEGYPDPDYLRSVTCCGIPAFGAGPGDGFAEEQYKENPGVRRILDAASRADDRPLWIGLWGGANTLAQAIWTAEQQMQWTLEPRQGEKIRPPVLKAEKRHQFVKAGSQVTLRVEIEETGCTDVNIKWYEYMEAGTERPSSPAICQDGKTEITFTAPEPAGQESEIHIIFEVSTRTRPFMTRYCRFIVTISA